MGCNILDRWECRRCRVVVAGNENPDAAVMKKPRNATIEDRRLMIIRCFACDTGCEDDGDQRWNETDGKSSV